MPEAFDDSAGCHRSGCVVYGHCPAQPQKFQSYTGAAGGRLGRSCSHCIGCTVGLLWIPLRGTTRGSAGMELAKNVDGARHGRNQADSGTREPTHTTAGIPCRTTGRVGGVGNREAFVPTGQALSQWKLVLLPSRDGYQVDRAIAVADPPFCDFCAILETAAKGASVCNAAGCSGICIQHELETQHRFSAHLADTPAADYICCRRRVEPCAVAKMAASCRSGPVESPHRELTARLSQLSEL